MNTRVNRALDRMAAQRISPDELHHIPDDPPAWLLDEAGGSVAEVKTPRVRVVTRRRVLVAGGLTATAAIGSTIVIPQLLQSRAYAATPPLLQFTPLASRQDPAALLTELADRAQRQPPPPGTGPYHYVHGRSWYLVTSMDTQMRIFDARVSESVREDWMLEDFSGRIEWIRDGQRDPISGPQPPGPHSLPFITGNSVEEARAALTQRYRGPSARWFNAAEELWGRQVVTPQVQSALLGILATKPDLVTEGETTDRAGRQGIAISTTAYGPEEYTPAMRYILVLNPDTGMLLSSERVALEAGDLPIQTPATIGYALYLRSGYTPDITTRP